MKKLFIICFAAVFGIAYGEEWKPVEVPKNTGFLQYDQDSLSKTEHERFMITWRSGNSSVENSHSITTAIIACDKMMYSLVSLKIIESNQVLIRYYGKYKSEYDYIARTYKPYSTSEPFPMHQADFLKRHKYPYFGSAESLLLSSICIFDEAKLQAWQSALVSDLQAGIPACKSNEAAAYPICNSDKVTISTLSSASLRAEQAQLLNPAASADVKRAFFASIKKSMRCKNRWNCLAPLAEFTDGIASDMSKLQEGDTSMPNLKIALEALAREREGDAAVSRYRACTTKKIRELDDYLSSADVIASAVFASCRSELPADIALSNSIDITEKPLITADVLSARKGNSTQKQKPKASINKTM